MSVIVKAPWTDIQISRLQAWQANDRVHPFTCPGDREGCEHHRELIPMKDGWTCACRHYQQDWAYGFMVE